MNLRTLLQGLTPAQLGTVVALQFVSIIAAAAALWWFKRQNRKAKS